MSFAATHESKDVRRHCEACRNRRARFQHRGRVRADRHHTLCFACFRAERERQRARLLADATVAAPLAVQPDGHMESGLGRIVAVRPTLTDRQVAHRQAMLANLQLARTAAGR